MRRPLVLAVLILLSRGSARADDAAWLQAIARATADEKPILAYLHTEDCLTAPGFNECEAFESVISHPAMQRRLRNMVYVKRVATNGTGVVACEPSGRTLAHWGHVPDPAALSKILTLVEGARPDIIEAHRASQRGDEALARRHLALAALALGMEGRGRAMLEEMGASEDVEDRELSSLWLDALRSKGDAGKRDEPLLQRLSEKGSTPRVRFEALLALASQRVSERRVEQAVALCNSAVEIAPTPELAKAASAQRQRALDRSSPVVGLGDYNTIVVGRRAVQPRAAPPRTASVEYLLDGRVVTRATKAPFIAAINFGRSPRRRVLELRLLDSKRNELQRAGVAVNDRSDAFSIQLTEPAGEPAEGQVDVAALVRVPRGRRAEAVTFEWRGEVVTQLAAPPYRTAIDVAPGEVAVLRAAVRLDDGSEAEDVRLLNAPISEKSSVHLVELPVHVERMPAPSSSLVLREDGKVRPIERIISADEAPLRVALLLDTSLSMGDHMFDLQESAVRFVENSLRQRDQAMVMAFGSGQSVLWPTVDHALVQRTILNLQPAGGTALHNAIISALLAVQSPGSRRAVVVFTDGIDNMSTFSISDVETVAKQVAVPIYVLMFDPGRAGGPAGLPGRMNSGSRSVGWDQYQARRALMRISAESGGRTFELDSLSKADEIWSAVAGDLNRQALLIYRTDRSSSSFRTIEIKAPAKSIRAPKGIYVSPDPEDGR